MVLAAALSLHVTTCPPSRALERAHPAHPRYYYNKFWLHWSENWKCSTWGPTVALAFAGRGTGQHRARVAKKLLGQTFIHLWVQKPRWLHLHSMFITVLGKTEHHSLTRSPRWRRLSLAALGSKDLGGFLHLRLPGSLSLWEEKGSCRQACVANIGNSAILDRPRTYGKAVGYLNRKSGLSSA